MLVLWFHGNYLNDVVLKAGEPKKPSGYLQEPDVEASEKDSYISINEVQTTMTICLF